MAGLITGPAVFTVSAFLLFAVFCDVACITTQAADCPHAVPDGVVPIATESAMRSWTCVEGIHRDYTWFLYYIPDLYLQLK